MRSPDFAKCTHEATKLLSQQKMNDRILLVEKMKYDKNIIFESLQNYCQLTRRPLSDFLSSDKQILQDGCTLYDSETDTYIVLYNEEVRIKHFEHFNWTLGHEIGHIYLDHHHDGNTEEIEAHFFAAQLFMPEYSIYMMAKEHGPISAEAIMKIFGVSYVAACKRIDTLNKRYCFNSTEDDKYIWKAQSERIQAYFDSVTFKFNYEQLLDYINQRREEYEQEMRADLYAQMSYY